MDALFLAAYLALPILTLWRSRSIAWTVVFIAAAVSITGAFVNFALDLGHLWTRTELQWVLLVALLVPTAVAFVVPAHREAPRRRQLLTVGVPFVGLAAVIAVITVRFTEVPAFLTPVSFIMGHAVAEDNAKWLDFTAMLASGMPIDQGVPMGGPLQLVLVLVATAMGVVSQVALGGYNEVAVAANTVIYGQFLMVALVPLVFAPMAEARLRRTVAEGRAGRTRIPWPLLWTGMLTLAAAVLLVTAYGHLTLQFTMLVCTLWVGVFLMSSRVPQARLLTSLVVAAGMTVWLPMNAIAAVVIVGWIAVLGARLIRGPRVRGDWIGLGLTVAVGVFIWEPLRSSVAFVIGSAPASALEFVGGMGGGVRAAVGVLATVPGIGPVVAGLDESTLFSAGGGTEQTTAVLAVLAAVAGLAAAGVASRQDVGRAAYLRLLPVLLLVGFAVVLNALDQWATGSAPHYGSLKFTFMVTIVVIAACAPVAMLLIDPRASAMTLGRWAAVGAVVYLLIVDSLLTRSIAAARPEQWSPPIPFDNTSGSYWYPADVNGSPTQPIALNPVACVYLPPGANVPSALMESGLSDPQRVYSCTRLIAGLAGSDSTAQPLVDWLRREWLTNTPAWSEVYNGLVAMPDSVQDKPVILLDEGSNVIGLETVRSLLARFPQYAGKTPEELAAINAAQ